MRGRIKNAKVSISYIKKIGAHKTEKIISPKVECLIVVKEISQEKRSLKFKERTIKRVCRQLKLKYDKLNNPNIHEIQILTDHGKTLYEV